MFSSIGLQLKTKKQKKQTSEILHGYAKKYRGPKKASKLKRKPSRQKLETVYNDSAQNKGEKN